MARIAFLLMFVCLSLPTLADAPRSALSEAERLLAAGEADAALNAFRDLQVEYPEDAAVQFGAACAMLMRGTNAVAASAPEEALVAYGEARAAFGQLSSGVQDRNVRIQSSYNLGIALLYSAQLLDAQAQYEDKVGAYEGAISAFGEALSRDPHHTGARQNQDHARYQLKLLLQNPPEQEESQERQPPPEDQPRVFSVFMPPQTEIPGANAVKDEDDIVRLIPPGAGP